MIFAKVLVNSLYVRQNLLHSDTQKEIYRKSCPVLERELKLTSTMSLEQADSDREPHYQFRKSYSMKLAVKEEDEGDWSIYPGMKNISFWLLWLNFLLAFCGWTRNIPEYCFHLPSSNFFFVASDLIFSRIQISFLRISYIYTALLWCCTHRFNLNHSMFYFLFLSLSTLDQAVELFLFCAF